MWVYGCLSDDSEVLTRDGWERYHTARHKEILAYDPQADIYQWERPSRWSEYRVESDTAYRIESDQTDQIVSRNHRCLVERGGVLAFVAAEECSGVERVPYLQGDVSSLPQKHWELLLADMLRQGEGLAEATRGERQGEEAARQRVSWCEESGVERRADVLQAEGQVRRPVDQVCAMPSSVRGHGSKGWLRYGASADCGDGDWEVTIADRVCASHQPQCDGQQDRESNVICDERGPQAPRTRASYQTTLATVTPIEYTGVLFCPTVSTGAFVARRNGKVFVTGNSGFPKSLDVSKSIDKAAGAEREVVGEKITGRALGGSNWRDGDAGGQEMVPITAPATTAARQWSGWGTALKPAWEPIIMARKPLIGTVAENVLQYGTGGINVDACRVGFHGEADKAAAAAQRSCQDQNKNRTAYGKFNNGEASLEPYLSGMDKGRWPANVVHDGSEEVVAMFPQANGVIGAKREGGDSCIFSGGGHKQINKQRITGGIKDSGSAARFFYVPKASKADRDEGCDGFDLRAPDHGRGNTSGGLQVSNSKHHRANHHPTVKPTALMRYLCRLVTQPGGLVLDPFTGSGSTGKAAILEGFRFIGTELEAEYFEIAKARIAYAIANYKPPEDKPAQLTLLPEQP